VFKLRFVSLLLNEHDEDEDDDDDDDDDDDGDDDDGDKTGQHYYLRARRHNRQLVDKSNKLFGNKFTIHYIV